MQPKVPGNLARISVRHELKADELNEWLDWLVSDNLDETILRLVDQFVPKIADQQRELAALQSKHHLFGVFTPTIVGHDGRTIARAEGDDGALVRHMTEGIAFSDLFLAKAFERLIATHQLTTDKLMALVTQSPVWQSTRNEILKKAIEAFLTDDHIVTIHILVSEIESAVRSIAQTLRLPLQKPNRMGGFDIKNLSDFLSDSQIESCLTPDIALYMRVLLTDRRGINLRNNTCHGLIPATSFNAMHARRLMHVVLLLGSIREETPNDNTNA